MVALGHVLCRHGLDDARGDLRHADEDASDRAERFIVAVDDDDGACRDGCRIALNALRYA